MSLQVKHKLQILALIPMLLILFLLGERSFRHFVLYQEETQVLTYVDLATYNSALVHEFQKERGATAGWLGSKAPAFRQKLEAQRQLTDQVLANWKQQIAPLTLPSKRISEKLSRVQALIDQLITNRNAIDAGTMPLKDALTYYTGMNAEMLSIAELVAYQNPDADLAKQVHAYTSLLQSKERAGIERAVLSNTFSAGKFAPGLFARFISLVSEQKTYSHVFETETTPELRDQFLALRSSPEYVTVEQMRQTAMGKVGEGNFGIEGPVWFDAATKRINALKQFEDKVATQLITNTQALLTSARTALIVDLLIMISAIVLIGWLSRSIILKIQRQLGNLTHTLSRVRDERDLSLRIPASGNDEFAQIADSVNQTLALVSEAMHQVSNAAETLDQAARQTLAAVEATQHSLKAQTGETLRVSAAVEEVAASISEVAQSTSQASDAATHANNLSSGGQSKMAQTLNTIERLHKDIGEVGKVTRKLEESSSTISDVTNVINAISEQTNLLALNAAIEAARAGDQGRGFAVVADEVRTLAQRTHSSTIQIEEIIDRLCQQTSAASSQVETNTRDMNEALSEASEINTTLGDIAGSIDSINQLSTQIAAAAQQQSAVVSDISQSVSEIDTNAHNISDQADSLTQHANQLTELSQQLNSLIKRFRL